MQEQCLAVSYVCSDRSELEGIHELDGLLSSALNTEAHYTTGTLGKILLLEL